MITVPLKVELLSNGPRYLGLNFDDGRTQEVDSESSESSECRSPSLKRDVTTGVWPLHVTQISTEANFVNIEP